jgi:hypothetical protein
LSTFSIPLFLTGAKGRQEFVKQQLPQEQGNNLPHNAAANSLDFDKSIQSLLSPQKHPAGQRFLEKPRIDEVICDKKLGPK